VTLLAQNNLRLNGNPYRHQYITAARGGVDDETISVILDAQEEGQPRSVWQVALIQAAKTWPWMWRLLGYGMEVGSTPMSMLGTHSGDKDWFPLRYHVGVFGTVEFDGAHAKFRNDGSRWRKTADVVRDDSGFFTEYPALHIDAETMRASAANRNAFHRLMPIAGVNPSDILNEPTTNTQTDRGNEG